jgi:hypothetical protein
VGYGINREILILRKPPIPTYIQSVVRLYSLCRYVTIITKYHTDKKYSYDVIIIYDTTSYRTPHNYSYFDRFLLGLRAVLIFTRWSKYIKYAKFYAESNGGGVFYLKPLHRHQI